MQVCTGHHSLLSQCHAHVANYILAQSYQHQCLAALWLICRFPVPQVDSAIAEEPEAPRKDLQSAVLDKILKKLIFDSEAEVRSAACVWLVSLCTFTGRQPQLLQRLPDIQDAFSNLLGDSSELAQVLRPHCPYF